MIDFQKLWEERQAGTTQIPELKESDLQNLKECSDSPIHKLKRNIHINSAFAFVFFIVFIALIIFVEGFYFRVFTAFVSVFYLASIVFNTWIIRKYLNEIPHDESLLMHLKAIHTGMTKAFRAQELSSILILPIAMTAGFLLPLTWLGKLDLFYNGYGLWFTLFALYIVLTPICYWLGKYLNKLAFGKYIQEIGVLVSDLEQNTDVPV